MILVGLLIYLLIYHDIFKIFLNLTKFLNIDFKNAFKSNNHRFMNKYVQNIVLSRIIKHRNNENFYNKES